MSAIEQQVLTGTWTADKVHSSVGFAVKHMVVATFRGTFADYDATLRFEDGLPFVDGAVRAASVEVRDENLKGHLASPEFFDVERTPEITFTTTSARPGEGDEIVVEGDLSLKGHTERVDAHGTLTYIAEDMTGGERVGLELETTIDRTRFGLNWNAPLPKGGFAVANDVKLQIHLEFVKEA